MIIARVLSSAAVRGWLLHPAKVLSQPLLVLLVIAIACVIAARRGSRRMLNLGLVALIALWIASSQLTADFLLRSLAVPPDEGEPEIIVILSGGSDRQLALLSSSSLSRITEGVAWWREHPGARFVLSGVDLTTSGTSARTLELMRDMAIADGVPPQRIELETWSTNTLDHPRGLLRLPRVTPATRIGLVTSSWHMRRARLSFRRRFATVITHPARGVTRPLVFSDFLPSADGIRDTTVAVHEWLGIAWYALKR